MLRVRRYRIYMVLAAVGLLLLYRMTQDTDWEALSTRPIDYTSDAGSKLATGSKLETEQDGPNGGLGIQRKRPQQKPIDGKEQGESIVKIPELREPEEGKQVDYTLPTSTSKELNAKPTEADDNSTDKKKADSETKTTDTPQVVIPNRKTPHQIWAEEAEKERLEQELLDAEIKDKQGFVITITTKSTSTSTIHWRKPTEVFPVAPESLLTLPTGKPKSIPRVQYAFKDESEAARQAREGRLSVVKSEMQRAWTGYKKYAWMHDELSPVSLRFRDPFCGWAATLVDALDTLWIMGMKEEFAEAVEAVGKIDFTTSPRTEIPVFETTIRYLGGLLGAYDVSGGKQGGYDILLDKAIELAEILMGVFDTPNRMPVLYYNWKPAFTGKARRAGSSVSVAELGSLLMEFTRLAQVTQDNRYYDAVARITDAFEEWQLRPNGTDIPGIFPEHVDASGCNKTAAQNAQMKFTAEQEANVQSVLDAPDDYTGQEYTHKSRFANTMNTVPDLALSDKADRLGTRKTGSRKRTVDIDVDSDEDLYDHPLTVNTGSTTQTKKFTAPLILSAPNLYQQMAADRVSAEPYTIPEFTDVCYPQGLTAGSWGRNTFGMGGSQDSTYEYFPKQFLLLGGLEPKYETMHLKVVDAVKKWLLYRPMVPDNRDILFSAKVTTNGITSKDPISEFEVTHLTCFLGGMFGMAGKIFEEPVDVEIAKKLTDGCVWAYENTATGIMPEGATVVPCADTGDCRWNETLWHRYLDPMWDMREKQIDDYYKRKATAKAKAEKEKLDELRREAESELDDVSDANAKSSESLDIADLAEIADEMSAKSDAMADDKFLAKKKTKKRDLNTNPDQLETSSNDNTPPAKPSQKLAFEDPMNDILVAGGSGRVGKPMRSSAAQVSLQDEEEDRTKPDPARPLTHEEYVKARLENEKIPPGFVSVSAKHYILRPEAIESVWYMYRITGDTTWQEKGWKMFESIIAATQTEHGHSAITNVLVPGSDKDDAMESFWFAETLKYFYLLYSTPDVISLDEWVLNTEAHPFKRPLPSA
ncbi:hypothetical protein PFICI_14445 [Pestalotiopsis fici W106-1]|uniref:alpha-1,2-Mannosidase n=1 Tax=Pestalotiopsis fici (strain W106-1 / CGMCC3.15140) TaxID=1229662 RepID=W3WI89_PESFW|nr:uncharacterized protein PFICI_14445 [Pestalotiopsis fici W106-1]ETS73499.1 hypothetical protein PFICI_14445 [Pestalotiopsis fici W106-1]